MQINLINGFYIDTDNRSFTLKQKYIGTRKDGTKKESVKIISHCGSFEQALELFLRINQVPKEAKIAVDLMEYANYIEQSNKEAVQALKSVLDGNHDDVCEWKFEDEEANLYLTGCQQRQLIFDGTPKENGYRYCPYCGKKIKIVGD